MDISSLILTCNITPVDTLEVSIEDADDGVRLTTQDGDTVVIGVDVVLTPNDARTLAKRLLDMANYIDEERKDEDTITNNSTPSR